MMNHRNQGLTVGELSITITILIIIGFIWTNLAKEKETQEVSMFLTTSNKPIHIKQLYK